MDSQQLEARIQVLESELARVDAGLSGAILATNGLHEAVQVVSTCRSTAQRRTSSAS